MYNVVQGGFKRCYFVKGVWVMHRGYTGTDTTPPYVGQHNVTFRHLQFSVGVDAGDGTMKEGADNYNDLITDWGCQAPIADVANFPIIAKRRIQNLD
jgi:hypothetical protein